MWFNLLNIFLILLLVLQIDLEEKKAKTWYDEGAVPSEPFFVARPGATEEDDGEVTSCSNHAQNPITVFSYIK